MFVLSNEHLILCRPAGKKNAAAFDSIEIDNHHSFSSVSDWYYTCQLFLRCRREIFILGVLGFLKTTRSFPKIPEEVRSLPKAKLSRKRLSTKSEIARKVLSFIHFTHGFRSLHGSELTYFWKLCHARRQQLTFFDQAWEIGPQAWAGVRSKFSTRRRETHA